MSKDLKPVRQGVLFVCYGNACRSIMAEALAKHYFSGSLRIGSAGIAPLGHIPQSTLEVLKESGVSVDGLASKDLEEMDPEGWDILVNLTDIPIGRFVPRAFRGRIIDNYIPDPYGRSLESFRKTRDAIERMVRERLPAWLKGGS